MFEYKSISSIVNIITSPVDKKTTVGEISVALCNYTDVYYNSIIVKNMNFMIATATQNEIERFSLQVGDVIITKDSESANDIGVAAYVASIKSNLLCGYHLAILRPSALVDGKFLAFSLRHSRILYDFYRYANGVTRFGLTLDTYDKIMLPLPPLPEQKAIADILSTWDEAIEKIKRLIKAKEKRFKGLLHSLLCEKKDWRKVALGEVFEEVCRKVGEKKLKTYSISAGIGFVSQYEKWGKDISGSQHKNYMHLKVNEFAYNKGNSKRYKQGCIYLLKNREICVPNVFICFKSKSKKVISNFFEHYFIANYHSQELKRYITSGARSDGLLNLNKKDFFSIKIPLPPLEEQKQIASVLNTAQDEIAILKTIFEKYKEQKKGLMQKLLVGDWRVSGEIVKGYEEEEK